VTGVRPKTPSEAPDLGEGYEIAGNIAHEIRAYACAENQARDYREVRTRTFSHVDTRGDKADCGLESLSCLLPADLLTPLRKSGEAISDQFVEIRAGSTE
jgi:hypothetical protein